MSRVKSAAALTFFEGNKEGQGKDCFVDDVMQVPALQYSV
jgi:hypothetical protein